MESYQNQTVQTKADFNFKVNPLLSIALISSQYDTSLQNSTLALANLLLQVTSEVSMIATKQSEDIHDSLEGTYSGPMDDNDADNDPGIFELSSDTTKASNEINQTNALSGEISAYYQSASSTANSISSTGSSMLKMIQNFQMQNQNFMSEPSKILSYLNQLTQMSLA